MMKSFILIFGTFLLSTSLFGGTFGITLSVEPENPIAGEEVTFTVNNLDFFCSEDFKDEGTGPTLDPGDGSEAITLTLSEFEVASYVGTHTYTTAGSFTPSVFCPFSTSAFPISGNPVITVSPAPAPIPTLGEWGLILLSLVMLGVGMIYLGQRKGTPQRVK